MSLSLSDFDAALVVSFAIQAIPIDDKLLLPGIDSSHGSGETGVAFPNVSCLSDANQSFTAPPGFGLIARVLDT